MLPSDNFLRTLSDACQISRKTFRPLSAVEAISAFRYCQNDAPAVAHACAASLVDATLAISEQRFTWSTVQLYYSAFYSLRARLLLAGESVFYRDSSPLYVSCTPGSEFIKEKGNSHSVVLRRFSTSNASDLLISQPIGEVAPLSWMEERRNEASYKTAPFPDPNPPEHLRSASQNLRRSFSEYFSDNEYLYAFQPEHAALAFAVLCFRLLDQDLESAGKSVDMAPHYGKLLIKADCNVGALSTLKGIQFQ